MTKIDLLAATALVALISTPATAQVTESGTEAEAVTEEEDEGETPIIVTASKREQTLQEIPISVSVTDDVTIERAQIDDLIDLQSVVPSLRITQQQNSSQTSFGIRGFASIANNVGVEPAVGVFIDGVYRSRSAAAIADLPEIERVEVLRGPQSTLFGKNTSAGAISVITKRPSFDWGLKAEATVGNYGAIQANATITGPIAESLAFRASGSFNTAEGYTRNINIGGDVNGRDRYALRGDLLFEPSADFSIRVIADYNKIDEVCCTANAIFNGPATLFIGAPPPFGLGRPISDPNRVYEYEAVFDQAPQNKLVGKGISGQIDYDLGFANLTSITAYRKQTDDNSLDTDFSGAAIAINEEFRNIKTFTQEVRLASNGDGPFNYLLGAFYFDEDISNQRDITFGRDIRAFVNGLTGGAVGQLETLQSLVNPTVIPGRTYFQAGQGILDGFTLENRSYSFFGQLDYEIIDGLVLTGGAAYLNDRKKAASNIVLTDRFSQLNLNNVPELGFLPLTILNPAAPPAARIPTNLFAGLAAVQFFQRPVNFPNANETGVRKDDKIVYAARVAYDVADWLNVYASYSTGWKAGAFNLSSDSRPPDANGVGRSVDPENVEVYEIGAKANFNGGFINLAVFDQTIEGFQSNPFLGTSFALVNAGSQSVKGFEIDVSYRPVRGLTLAGAATYLDPLYDSFTMAPCTTPGSLDPARCGAGQRFRDLSGERPNGISEWTVNLNATYAHEFSDKLGGFIRGEYVYVSERTLIEGLNFPEATATTNTVNGSIGLSLPEEQFEVMLWVRNLTNDEYLLTAFPTVAQSGSFSGYPSPPRTYGVTLRKSF